INAWVEEETKEKIKDLIPKGVLNEMTRLVLTNAIYFKGDWASQFDKKLTADAPFTLADGKKVQVAMMHRKGDYRYLDAREPRGILLPAHRYTEMGAFQALELPYVKDELSMLVLLPSTADGLPALEKSLTAERLDALLSAMREREVQVYLPRFKLTYKVGLSETLKSMGMTDAFSLPPADFSGMDGAKDLFISAVLHKAFVDVNEEGTEAAAATGIVVGITSVRLMPIVFRADHPFLFLIRDNKSGSILFMGRLVNPER
ncbi:MAG: serpin family protein, partial [Candidatus Brocadiia bacterium]|nr:serpin family protein [Candidatus Brocadiia bacterium]